jgi:carbon monoxide dehydrogenase subunit G
MIRFEGHRHIALPTEAVAAKLTDASFLVNCQRNVIEIVEQGPDKAVWKLRTGFSFLSTTLEVSLSVTERSAERAAYVALSRGVGATSLVRAELKFQALEAATTVHYSAEVAERTGFLKIVSPGLIQAAAKTVIEETWKAIEEKLAAGGD